MASLMRLLDTVKHMGDPPDFDTPAPGCAAEFGVFQGGGIKAIAERCPNTRCYGFDTFTGLPEAMHRPGEIHPRMFEDTSIEAVRAEMPGNVILVEGMFPDSIHRVPLGFGYYDVLRFFFVHLDFDYYLSTKAAIEYLVPRMLPGGLIVFDDYNKVGLEGVSQAIVEARLRVVQTHKHQAYWTAP